MSGEKCGQCKHIKLLERTFPGIAGVGFYCPVFQGYVGINKVACMQGVLRKPRLNIDSKK